MRGSIGWRKTGVERDVEPARPARPAPPASQPEVSPRRRAARSRAAAKRNALTVLVPIRPERLEMLELVLEEIGRNIRRNAHVSLHELKTTHFLRWVILPGARGDDGQLAGRPLLALEANFDHTAGDFLEDLARVAGRALRECIYCHCDPPAPEEGSVEALADYLLDHALPEALFYRSYPGLTVEGVDNDARVRALIQDFLDTPPRPVAPRRKSRRTQGARLHEDIRRHLERARRKQATQPVLMLDPEPRPLRSRPLQSRLVRRVLGALALPVALPAGLALLALELAERVGERANGDVIAWHGEEMERLGALLEREDLQAQNQLTHLADVKPGVLRLLLLELALWIWGYWATHYFTEGRLGGIEGIHFARWVLVTDKVAGAGGRRRRRHRLLFFSNYDGSWEQYLGNFVDRASVGLTSIWCNTEGFPRTRLRVWPPRIELGADREEDFKQWVRRQQVYTQVWFSRHPDLSVSNITNNREIRARVRSRMTSRQLREWLRRL